MLRDETTDRVGFASFVSFGPRERADDIVELLNLGSVIQEDVRAKEAAHDPRNLIPSVIMKLCVRLFS